MNAGMLQRIWKSKPLGVARQTTLRAGTAALTTTYSLYKTHPAMWRLTATSYQPWMGDFARLHAWMTCQLASLNVPAYQQHLSDHDWSFQWWDLTNFPPTDKGSYVQRFTEVERTRRGRLELRGTIVDESSGSSGAPFNWVRGRDELADIHRNVAGFTALMMREEKNLFVINAYSMGAWATGTNTGIAMAKIAMVKNTGPDLDKIVDTMRHFGPGFTYLVAAYPPFLKDLRDRLDDEGWDWPRWRMHGLVGGEGMTEALRTYCEERFLTVRSGYGASDLTIGIGGETDLTVWLRRTLMTDPQLRERILGPNETRTPMVFQYNPLETYLEVNDEGHLLCTLTSTSVLSPKLRYNIGDEARLMTWQELSTIVAEEPRWHEPATGAFAKQRMKLPLLLLFGRADATISFMGANIYPQDVENGLYSDPEQAAHIKSFTLTLEDSDQDPSLQQPTIHLELRDGLVLSEAQVKELQRRTGAGVLAYLAQTSRDFAQSLTESSRSHEMEVHAHPCGTGPFRINTGKLKRVYLRDSEETDAAG